MPITNKEAAAILRKRKTCMECVCTPADCDKCIEAFDRAIQMLEEYPTDGEIQADMYKTYCGGGKVVPNIRDGWRYEE